MKVYQTTNAQINHLWLPSIQGAQSRVRYRSTRGPEKSCAPAICVIRKAGGSEHASWHWHLGHLNLKELQEVLLGFIKADLFFSAVVRFSPFDKERTTTKCRKQAARRSMYWYPYVHCSTFTKHEAVFASKWQVCNFFWSEDKESHENRKYERKYKIFEIYKIYALFAPVQTQHFVNMLGTCRSHFANACDFDIKVVVLGQDFDKTLIDFHNSQTFIEGLRLCTLIFDGLG